MLQLLPHLDVTLIDLSQPMLQRAQERIRAAGTQNITAQQGDVRELQLGDGQFDIIMAAAVLHHLRGDEEWHDVFAKFYRALRPGGSVWIFDMLTHSTSAIHELMWRRYGEYLAQLKDEAYREQVFAYIEKEDTPRPLLFQVDALRAAGFNEVEILHKNSCFAAFGAMKK
jgi:tRNA (cmo5U34)-methyltransferase